MSCVSYLTSVEVGGTRTVGPPKNVRGTPLLGVGLSAVGFSNRGGTSRRGALSLLSPGNTRPLKSAPIGAGENSHTGAQRGASYMSFRPRETQESDSDESSRRHTIVRSKVVAVKALHNSDATPQNATRDDEDRSYEHDCSTDDAYDAPTGAVEAH